MKIEGYELLYMFEAGGKVLDQVLHGLVLFGERDLDVTGLSASRVSPGLCQREATVLECVDLVDTSGI